MLGTSKPRVPNARRAVNSSIRLVFMTPPVPDFDYLAFDFDRDPARMAAQQQSPPRTRPTGTSSSHGGGKAIVYAGISDPLLNTNGVLDWYRRMIGITAASPRRRSNSPRYFMCLAWAIAGAVMRRISSTIFRLWWIGWSEDVLQTPARERLRLSWAHPSPMRVSEADALHGIGEYR